MKHFIVIFHAISFLSGISAITLFTAAYIKYKKNLIKYYIFFIASMGMLLLEQTVSTYKIVNNLYSNILNDFIMVLSYISCSYLIYVVPLFIYKLINIEQTDRRKNLYSGLALIPLISLIDNYIFKSGVFVWIANMVLFTVIIACLILTIKNFKRITNDKIKSCIKILCIFSAIFVPYMYLDTKTEYISFLSENFPYGLLSVPAFYFVWNGVSIYWVIKYLKEKVFASERQQNKRDYSKEFYDKYKITNREQEVIVLLIKGYSYKEISEQLVISLSTVKTHIRNIYQKTDVKNKIELVNMINEKNTVV